MCRLASQTWQVSIALRFFCSIAIPLAIAGSAEAQFGPANVIVSEVIELSVAPVQHFVATVMPLRKSIVGTAVDGRIMEFLFDANDPETKLTYVTKGTPLAQLRVGTIQIRIQEATAQRDLRRAEWEQAEQTHPGLIAQAVAKLKAATENYRFSKSQFERNQQLYANNATISLDAFELSRNQMFTAEQVYVDATIVAEHINRGDNIKQAKARLEEAEAVFNTLNDRMAKYTILAPFDGFVVAEHTEVGEWVREGDPIAVVVQMHPVEVRAFVPEAYVRQLQIGGKAIVHPKAELKQGETIPLGRITGVVAEAANRTRTFPVKIQVDNPSHVLKAGMLAEVEMEVGERQPATMVPKDALVLGGSAPHIVLAIPDPKDPQKTIAKIMAVRLGASDGKWIAVTAIGDELAAGDLVVEKGNERLRPGAQLLVNRQGATLHPERK
ncbi:MAG: RND family efflux transporter MFP subunit [Pirellulaceae bacterium]|jgi:RND family efflux transporter MFP subunit